MQQKSTLSCLFFISTICFTFSLSSSDLDDSRTISPLFAHSYQSISHANARKGHAISTPGLYKIAGTKLTIASGDLPSNSHNVGGSNETRSIIAITSSNVTLDLNGAMVTTDKANHVVISVGDDLHNITIKNGVIGKGSSTFDSGILIGQNCSEILIEDIIIQGTSHADGAIQIKAGASNTSDNIVLKNISVSHGTTLGLKASYCNDLHIENFYSNSQTAASGTLSSININNCNNVTGANVHANNNSGNNGTIGFEIDSCNDVIIDHIFTTNNTDASGGANSTEGVKINNCNNVYVSDVKANNLTKTKYGLSILTSQNVTVNGLQISNCTISAPQSMKTVLIQNSQSIAIKNGSISNNTATNQTLDCIACETSTNKGILLENIDIINNSSTGAEQQIYGIHLLNSEIVEIVNCTVARNSSEGNTYGIKVETSSTDVHCINCKVLHNSSSSTANEKIVAGVHCNATHGFEMENCKVNRNSGSGEAHGIYLDSLNHALIYNCTANGNAAATGVSQHKPTAGLFIKNCNHCFIENSKFNYNQAGNNTTATSSDQNNDHNINTNVTIGAGIINTGDDAVNNQNKGNTFINCRCHGNRTQIGTTEPSSSNVQYDTGRYRYSTQHHLAVGAYNQFSKHSTYENCSFNNNGFSNYVFSCGLLNDNTGLKTHVKYCEASNNGHYGFCDHGVLKSSKANSQLYFIGCLAITNGTSNDVSVAAQTNDHRRNYRVYYSTGATSEAAPVVEMNFETYTQLTSEHSQYINLSIKQTS